MKIKIVKDGLTVTSSAVSQTFAIPMASSNEIARMVRVNTTGAVYVQFGDDNVVATTNSILITEDDEFDVSGCDHFAVLQATAASILNIVPIEW